MNNNIYKFDAISYDWWNKNGKFKSLHLINPLRLDFILNKSNGLFNKKVLDIGCGGGILAESMAFEGAKVTGLDTDYIAITVAQLHALYNKFNFESLNYINQTIEDHANIYSNSYDVITCMEVLEHVLNPILIILACSILIKPEGSIFFSTLNRNLKSWLLAIIFGEYIFRVIPKGIHDFKKFIRPSELLSWIDKTSLYAKDIIGIKYDLIKRCFKLSNNINVNYILHVKSNK